MIIGRDLMQELGIMLDFEHGLIHWGEVQVPMTDMDNLPSFDEVHFATGIREPQSAAEAVERVSKILDAKYAPVTVGSKKIGPDEQRTDGNDDQRTDGELSTQEIQRRVTWADVVKISKNSKFKKEKTSNR